MFLRREIARGDSTRIDYFDPKSQSLWCVVFQNERRDEAIKDLHQAIRRSFDLQGLPSPEFLDITTVPPSHRFYANPGSV